MKTNFTQGEWKVSSANPTRVKTGDKIIADARCFAKEVSKEEAKANAKLIAAAPHLLGEIAQVQFYAKQALKSLDENSVAQVRGMLEGILEMSTEAIKIATK